MTLTDAQIRGLLAMEAKASREPRHEEVLFCDTGLSFTREEVALIVATRAHLRALCEEVLRLQVALIVATRAHLRALCEEVLRLRACESEVRTIDLTSLPKREPRFTFTDGPFDQGDGDPA